MDVCADGSSAINWRVCDFRVADATLKEYGFRPLVFRRVEFARLRGGREPAFGVRGAVVDPHVVGRAFVAASARARACVYEQCLDTLRS